MVQGIDRGEAHCTSDKSPDADEWKKIHQALRRIEKDMGLEKQFVERRVQTHVTGESRRQMMDEQRSTQKAMRTQVHWQQGGLNWTTRAEEKGKLVKCKTKVNKSNKTSSTQSMRNVGR